MEFPGKMFEATQITDWNTIWNTIFWGWWERLLGLLIIVKEQVQKEGFFAPCLIIIICVNTIPSCSTDKYCTPKACFCCTCTEVLTPVDQLKPGGMSALHQSPTVHCDLCMPWKIMLIMAKITLDKKHKWQYFYGQNSFACKSKKWLLSRQLMKWYRMHACFLRIAPLLWLSTVYLLILNLEVT